MPHVIGSVCLKEAQKYPHSRSFNAPPVSAFATLERSAEVAAFTFFQRAACHRISAFAAIERSAGVREHRRWECSSSADGKITVLVIRAAKAGRHEIFQPAVGLWPAEASQLVACREASSGRSAAGRHFKVAELTSHRYICTCRVAQKQRLLIRCVTGSISTNLSAFAGNHSITIVSKH